ncbi:MarR family winged helix-turn-helix transcriptional regulator [Caulobacter mirabilis]|uniref:MarR family winged helix-turn-helix transcriptional regulator n=1 Tax=Caulobacter mirabilis TaxID=69666 RepID=UPI00155841E8|nr:MarR family winged helix-turn-helix transcriptional regulator [Caulobacter mirabilis]
MRDEPDQVADVLLDLLREVERTAPGLSLGQLVMLLHILRREGVRVLELAELCGRTDAGVSRGVRAMAPAGEAGTLEPAYGLVELLRGADARARHLVPTSAGLALRDRLADIMRREPGR